MQGKKRKKKKEVKNLSISINKPHKNKTKNQTYASGGGAIYGVGFIGALIYYIQTATSFWMGILGFLKALVWPAFLVYELLKFLSA
jgi:hypothetical protein